MIKATASGVQDLDPFRSRQASEVLSRFSRERKRHQRQADLMWLGTLAAMFSDHELGILDDLGFLSQHDRDLIAQAQRHAGTPGVAQTG